ncbi:hypothetical protein BIV57_12210 [Mangrovactinospora gilvigrisea]|uniref:Uncharacterized protein n=1 Tax=Mangrovactinospora gilvigrisea TaxID=1428644 RepID=A0A1J7CBZ9_9ACTN|nr:hypothetical protein [Mangrovactinospora gilvigrisea]OIV37194.1 hypothetical protein BIV57_12210 [Mangrovactinospora gilvigrisea]
MASIKIFSITSDKLAGAAGAACPKAAILLPTPEWRERATYASARRANEQRNHQEQGHIQDRARRNGSDGMGTGVVMGGFGSEMSLVLRGRGNRPWRERT